MEHNMSRGRRKIAVIGAGNVGATCAFVLAQKKLGDIVTQYITSKITLKILLKTPFIILMQNYNIINI